MVLSIVKRFTITIKIRSWVCDHARCFIYIVSLRPRRMYLAHCTRHIVPWPTKNKAFSWPWLYIFCTAALVNTMLEQRYPSISYCPCPYGSPSGSLNLPFMNFAMTCNVSEQSGKWVRLSRILVQTLQNHYMSFWMEIITQVINDVSCVTGGSGYQYICVLYWRYQDSPKRRLHYS